MPSRSSARPFGLLTAAAAVTALAAATPAFAQTHTDDAPAAGAQRAASAPANGDDTQTPASAGNTKIHGGNNEQADNTKPPSQKLPEPKPSDYGSSTYNAPNDAQLDLFAATHHPPSDDNDGDKNDGNKPQVPGGDTADQAPGAPDATSSSDSDDAANPSNSTGHTTNDAPSAD